MHETLERLHEIEKNLLATYLSSNNSRFFILACPWLVVFSYACFYNSHCIDYILPYRQYHQLLWYLVFQGRQRALTSLLDQLHTVPMRPVKQIPMDRLYNRHCWGQQSWAHSPPPQHLLGVWPNDIERSKFVYWNHSAHPIYHLWCHSMWHFSLFSRLRPQCEHHCSET
jgi:hypothetical protein